MISVVNVPPVENEKAHYRAPFKDSAINYTKKAGRKPMLLLEFDRA